MASGDTTYTARFQLPDFLVQNRTQVIKCPVYLNGALVAPAAGGTVSVYNAAGNAVVDAQTVTVTGSIAEYQVASAAFASEDLGEGWRIEWTLTFSGVVYHFRNSAALVLRQLYPVVTDADLFRRVSGLDPAATASLTSETNYQDYLDEAWVELNSRVIGKGNRPYLVLEPTALRNVHLYLTLAVVFENLSAGMNEDHKTLAAMYRQQYEQAWTELAFDYDYDHDGVSNLRRKQVSASIWLAGRS